MKPQRAGPPDSARIGAALETQTNTGAPRDTGLFFCLQPPMQMLTLMMQIQFVAHGPPAGRDTKQVLPVTYHENRPVPYPRSLR